MQATGKRRPRQPAPAGLLASGPQQVATTILAPGLVLGTFSGSLVAGQVPTGPMTAIVVVIVYYAALQMMLDFKPKAHRQLPGPVGLFAAGGSIGVVSSLVAAGG